MSFPRTCSRVRVANANADRTIVNAMLTNRSLSVQPRRGATAVRCRGAPLSGRHLFLHRVRHGYQLLLCAVRAVYLQRFENNTGTYIVRRRCKTCVATKSVISQPLQSVRASLSCSAATREYRTSSQLARTKARARLNESEMLPVADSITNMASYLCGRSSVCDNGNMTCQ